MNNDFIKRTLHEAIYQRKEGTASSYYRQSGSSILPNRMSISQTSMTNVKKKGRMLLHHSVGQCVGRFTKAEHSPLKSHSPFDIRTQIWLNPDYPQFIGYGTAGISNEAGKVTNESDTGDLLVFYSDDADWKTIRVFIFMGMGRNPDTMDIAMSYARTLL